LVLAAVAALATAAQVAVISSQTFAEGGIPRFKKSGVFGGRPHSQGGTKGRFSDGTNVEVEEDEVFIILNKRASKQIRQLSDFNYRHGGRKFETGGSLDFTPQTGVPGDSPGTVTVIAQAVFSEEQVQVIAGELASQTADKTQKAVVAGLDEKNRTAERELLMQSNREV
jgi:hypothetical protein